MVLLHPHGLLKGFLDKMTPDEIITKYKFKAYAIAKKANRMFNYRIPVEDFAQCALMSSLESIKTYDPGSGTEGEWVGLNMRYALLDMGRKEEHTRRRHQPKFSYIDEENCYLWKKVKSLPSHNFWPSVEAQLDVEKLLKVVNPLTRNLFRHSLLGKTSVEIAADMGMSQGAVENAIFIGRGLMRKAATA